MMLSLTSRGLKALAISTHSCSAELTRYVDLFRERSGDTAEITDTLRAWFLTEGSTALRTVIARAKSDAAHE